jgi:hypothetical protein
MNRAQKLAFTTAGIALGLTLMELKPAEAAQISLPDQGIAVLGTDINPNGSNVPSLTLTSDYTPTDTISYAVGGTVDLNAGKYTANAAGILTSSGYSQYPIGTLTSGSGNTPSTGDKPYGSLLIGNSQLGFYPLFKATAETGLGSSTPPTNLYAPNTSLASIFGPSFTGLSKGTTLQVLVNDAIGSNVDNVGKFVLVPYNPNPSTSVPEPTTLLGSLVFGAFGAREVLKRYQVKKIG